MRRFDRTSRKVAVILAALILGMLLPTHIAFAQG